jgi:hypothetical protein
MKKRLWFISQNLAAGAEGISTKTLKTVGLALTRPALKQVESGRFDRTFFARITEKYCTFLSFTLVLSNNITKLHVYAIVNTFMIRGCIP